MARGGKGGNPLKIIATLIYRGERRGGKGGKGGKGGNQKIKRITDSAYFLFF